jgi:para-aminobenzoate synthetase/4-amino-4-deoxychorismate lyase
MTQGLAPPFVLLEDRLRPGPGRLFARPREVIACDDPRKLASALERIQAGTSEGLHAAGFLSYEAFAAFEPKVSTHDPGPRREPLLWFGLFDAPTLVPGEELDRRFGRLPPPAPLEEVRFLHDLATHVEKVEAVKRLIEAGDLYQANLTFPILFRSAGSPESLYAVLRARQPTSHSALIATGDHWLLSVSPELFISLEDGRITARPMKGTAPRQSDPQDDGEARRSLRADAKQRAENLMITDLLRNDLSRICTPGSVETPELFCVETYPTFHAMTSTITGTTHPGTGAAQLLEATFPCGSVVGAPKLRAAQVIAELEAEPRGVYTGAIGWLGPDGEAAFNVAIRTAVIDASGEGRYGVGGAIVADSCPSAEYEEALLKARVLTDLAEDFHLIETFGWAPTSGFHLLERHLARLERSAEALGFEFDRLAVEASLAQSQSRWADDGAHRVRIALQRSGAVSIGAARLEPWSGRPLPIHISRVALDAADPFLRHKTSRRASQETAFAEAAAEGFEEAVLLNRTGRVADACRSTLFLERNGELLTPPVHAGALPGVLRAELISRGKAREAELTTDDLVGSPIFIGSSLRGLRPAILAI